MNAPMLPHELERFRTAISRRLGLQFDDTKLGLLDTVLRQRLDMLGRSGGTYLQTLEEEPTGEELGALAQELTVTETHFFRNNEQFRALAEIVVPARMRARETSKVLSFLSAGCATGEEPHSIAIVARETIADPSWTVNIRAVDANPAALEKAGRAQYSSWALRGTPPDILARWFRPAGRDLVLDDAVRAAVKFEQRNLAADDPALWLSAAYDAVFCRNVTMYFAPEQMRAVIARIAHSLAPGGFLFLGHAETLRGISDDFHLRHTHETFYYERKESVGRAAPRPVRVAPLSDVTQTPATNADWAEAIRQASERVAALIPLRTDPRPITLLPSPDRDMARILDLLRTERYADALVHVQDVPSDADKTPDMLLLEAMLLAHSGQLGAAENACLRLLLIDELNAGAHYVLALCRDSSGDYRGAGEHDRIAAYLDPAFAMPRLHLGLLARHAGERDTARRDLGQALVLLKREDPSRLLLFGGGFKREALIALCESALCDCGGRP
jgi:chemotaxis protein methyltransferase CheR